jgi:hypothetical protein
MNGSETDAEMLPPDDAFGVLGNETRIEILQTMAEGHFVRKTDDGYTGRRNC